MTQDICIDLNDGSIGKEIRRRMGTHVGLIISEYLSAKGYNCGVGSNPHTICFEDKRDIKQTIKYLEDVDHSGGIGLVKDLLDNKLEEMR